MKLSRLLLWLAVTLPTLGALLYFVVLSQSPRASVVYGLVKVTMIVVAIIGWRLSGRSIIRSLCGSWKDVFVGVVCGFGIVLFLCVAFFFLRSWLLPFGDLVESKAASLFPIAWYGIVAVVFSIGHSFLEEWYWRGYVHAQIEQTSLSAAAPFLSAFAFTAHHVVILSQLFPGFLWLVFSTGVFCVGVFWAILFRRTKSLIAPWISHALADGVIFVFGYLLI